MHGGKKVFVRVIVVVLILAMLLPTIAYGIYTLLAA